MKATRIAMAGAITAALSLGAVCPAMAEAKTVTHDGITYKTEKVVKPIWKKGGPNYRYQARVVKVKKKNRKHYTLPWSVKSGTHFYKVTEIDGDPFKACKRVKSITVWSPLAYVEDMTFWRDDKRHVVIDVRNCGAYEYLLGCTPVKVDRSATGNADYGTMARIK